MKPTITDTSDSWLHNKIHYDIKNQNAKLQWKVRLNKRLNPCTVNNETVRVYNEDHKLVKTNIICNSDNEITIQPLSPYNVGVTYTLELQPDIRDIDNQSLGRRIYVSFVIPGGTNDSAKPTKQSKTENSYQNNIVTNVPKKKSSAPLIAIPSGLILLLLIFFLFGGEKTIKGYTDESGNKYYYEKTHDDYDDIIQDKWFGYKFTAELDGYVEAP